MDLSIVGRIATGDEMRGESDYKEGILGPDSVLKSGDFFKINIKIDQSIYYYLILKKNPLSALRQKEDLTNLC